MRGRKYEIAEPYVYNERLDSGMDVSSTMYKYRLNKNTLNIRTYSLPSADLDSR